MMYMEMRYHGENLVHRVHRIRHRHADDCQSSVCSRPAANEINDLMTLL